MDGRERGQAVARAVMAILLVLLGLYVLQGFLRSLVWAAILAIALGPLYERTRRRFPRRGHDVVLPLLFALGATLLVLVPLGLVLTQLGREAAAAAEWVRSARADGIAPPDWLGRISVLHDRALAWWQHNLADGEHARAFLGGLSSRAEAMNPLRLTRTFGAVVLRRSVDFAFTIVTLFFLFREGERIGAQVLLACRKLFGPQAEPVARQMVASIHGTVDGLVLVGIGEGVALGIGYAIAGAPHPALLGLFTAIAAVIPMGAPVVLLLASALVLAAGKTVAAAVLLVVGMALIFAADHAIRPALIGGATKLPFLWVLLGILGGVETLGLLGLFVGPAIMAALILLWREWTRDATTVAPQ